MIFSARFFINFACGKSTERVLNGDHVAMGNCKYRKCKLIAKYSESQSCNPGDAAVARTSKSGDKDHFFLVTAMLNEPPITVEREER